ncbi:MAG TPA: hypothetical protein DCM40_06425, partial [Maribacter sp.]|nr:hypothetical protein [Maribacter sp.]
FGVDVFAGTTASLLLLLRKVMAFKLGLISIIATTVQILYFYFYSNISDVIGPTSMQMPLIIFAISFMLLLFIKYSIIKRWLA